MNTPDDLPEDEMVSAVLDGEAADATRAHVLSDPVLAERLAAFGARRDDMRSFTVPEGLLDDLRRTVVAQTAPPSARPVVAPVFDLSAKRARRAKAGAWLGAAAAVVLLVVAIGVTGGSDGGDGSSDASMTAAFSTGSGSGAALAESSQRADAAGSAAAPNRGAGTGSTGATDASGSSTASATGTKTPDASTGATAAPTPPLDLGAVTDLDALTAAYRARWSRVPTTTVLAAASPGANSNCGPATASASLDGRPVLLFADRSRINVVDRSTCAPIGTFIP